MPAPPSMEGGSTPTPAATAVRKRVRPQAADASAAAGDDGITAAPAAAGAAGAGDLLRSAAHYEMTRRAPLRGAATRDDVYVTRGVRLVALARRCRARLDASGRCVVHGLGAACARACDVALEAAREAGGRVTLDVRTDSVAVFDDFTPVAPGLPDVTRRRVKSAVHITITANDDYV